MRPVILLAIIRTPIVPALLRLPIPALLLLPLPMLILAAPLLFTTALIFPALRFVAASLFFAPFLIFSALFFLFARLLLASVPARLLLAPLQRHTCCLVLMRQRQSRLVRRHPFEQRRPAAKLNQPDQQRTNN